MQEITIHNFYGQPIGTIRIESNGDKQARDFYGRILGYYRKDRNVTTDFYGRILYRGDMVASLLHE